MDLGLDSPETLEALYRCLAVIEDIERRVSALPTDPAALGEPGSDIARLLDSLPDPPVDIRLTMLAAVASSEACLGQVKRLLVERIPTSPVVLATLCRTALLASARLLLIVGSRDPDVRQANATRILLQESESIQRCYKKAATFTELAALIPPAEVLDPQGRRHLHLKNIAKGISETEVLNEAAAIVAEIIEVSEDEKPAAKAVFAEHSSWTFNVYSGVAHGFGWPGLVPGTQSLPGDFSAELVLITTVCQLAIDRLQQSHLAPGNRA